MIYPREHRTLYNLHYNNEDYHTTEIAVNNKIMNQHITYFVINKRMCDDTSNKNVFKLGRNEILTTKCVK